MALPSLAPPPALRRPRVLVVGTTFASVAAVMLFVGLVGTYLLTRSASLAATGEWLPSGSSIPLTQPHVMLAGLLMSSITIQWAVSAVANDDRQNTYLALGLTTVFGIAYLNMTAYLYSVMELEIAASEAAVLIYAISGAHVAMAVVAMFFVAFMAFRALAGQYTSRQHDGISAAALFWHVMVGVYALIWLTVYASVSL